MLFLSAQPYDWFPLELIETEQAHQYVVQYDFKRKLVLTDSSEFYAFTDMNSISYNHTARFTLSEHGRCIEDLQRENEALRRKLAQMSKQVTDLAKLVNSPISLKIKAGIDGLTPGGPYVAIFGKLKVNGQIEDVY